MHIVGIDEPAKTNDSYGESGIIKEALEDTLDGLDHDSFKILLSHRPEFFSLDVQYSLELVLSGNAHVGQVRIPFVGGLVAPNHGFFPKYTAGTHTKDNTVMIVNRGLGNSIIPFRIFNRPEIIEIQLELLKSE
ncbi:metallophosphoesterase family protein [Bacillus alkalisoli]|uniref:hypothetical protein n=1 Tax=Bacillus alkalisoli TaxID=2011008 RepID=UPI000C2310E4|nr:hypothetical protein [Bacillus alkalisoli]